MRQEEKPLTFIVGGREVTAATLLRDTVRPPPKTRATEHKTTHDRSEAALSMGFVVLGRPADYLDELHLSYANELKLNADKPKEYKHPGDIEAFTRRWKTKHKPKRIGRPYSLESAAKTCAELARKSGYVEVEVSKLLKT